MTLFDKDGNPVAYIEIQDENTIYLWDGTPVAYLDSENIYGFNGKHLGWFNDSIIRNHEGEKSGFTKSSVPVNAKFEPFKSFKQFKPFKSFKEFAPFKPFDSSSISSLPLKDFLKQGQ
ncbi:4-fold beta flower protein [Geofilum sp. OHC36d9]|uniref:4-fold beta flower protein n=1 Tax=Geofilum sp. OHC36d9 TaxID=3458413 RepID=UPI0040342971